MKLNTALLAACLTLGVANLANAGDAFLPPIGGGGGGQFVARCQGGDILTGFEMRTGNDVDAIRPICATALSAAAIGPRNFYPGFFGGEGGGLRQILCPDNIPLVTAFEVGFEGEKTIIVNNVHLWCAAAVPNQRVTQYPQAAFDGPAILVGSSGPLTGGDPVYLNFGKQGCPPNMVAVGINGRSGIWLDAVGLICGDPPLNPNNPPVKSIGRINTGAPPAPPRPICDAAREARARNSPAAANLEAQCNAYNASKVAAPVAVRQFGSTSTMAVAAKSPLAIIGAAPPHPDQPAPPLLDLDGMAARGAEIAQHNALAEELRLHLAEGPTRRGFDIGTAAYENQQLPDKINGAAGQQLDQATFGGFRLAQSFWLTWNRNVDLALIGAWIANGDGYIARARGAEDDPFYKLGFDIATGIYGDRKQGARGNTATGPGAFAIRDQMTETAQRAFNASTALNLSRHY